MFLDNLEKSFKQNHLQFFHLKQLAFGSKLLQQRKKSFFLKRHCKNFDFKACSEDLNQKDMDTVIKVT